MAQRHWRYHGSLPADAHMKHPALHLPPGTCPDPRRREPSTCDHCWPGAEVLPFSLVMCPALGSRVAATPSSTLILESRKGADPGTTYVVRSPQSSPILTFHLHPCLQQIDRAPLKPLSCAGGKDRLAGAGSPRAILVPIRCLLANNGCCAASVYDCHASGNANRQDLQLIL